MNPELLTTREKLRECEQASRELIEHLEQGFLPRVDELQSKSRFRPGQTDYVPDITIRNLAAGLIESHRYTSSVETRLERLGTALSRELGDMLQAGGSSPG